MVKNDTNSWKQILKPKRYAYAGLSLMINNSVTTYVYIGLMFIDYFFVIYATLAVTFTSAIQLNLNQSWQFEVFAARFDKIKFLLYIKVFLMMIIQNLLFLRLLLTVTKISEAKTQRTISKIGSFYITFLQTSIPYYCIYVIMEPLFLLSKINHSGIYYTTICVSGLSFILYLWNNLFLYKILLIRMPYWNIPQSRIGQNQQILNITLRILIAIIHNTASKFPNTFAKYSTTIFLVFFLFCGFKAILQTITSQTYNSKVAFFYGILNWIIFANSCTQLFNNILEKGSDSLKIQNFAFFVIISLLIRSLLLNFRKRSILNDIEKNQIKSQLEYELSLKLILELLRNYNWKSTTLNDSKLNLYFSIVEAHSFNCCSIDCICQQMDSIVWIIQKQKQRQGQVLTLKNKSIDFLNSINDQELYPLNQYVDASYSLSEQKSRQVVDIEQKKSIELKLFEDNFGQSSDQVQENQTRFKIDVKKLLHGFFIQFFKMYFREARKKHPNAQSIKFQNAFFKLYLERNIFDCLIEIKSNNYSQESNTNQANILLNQYYLLLECEYFMKNREQFESGYIPDRLGVISQDNKDQNTIQINSLNKDLDPEHYMKINKLQTNFNKRAYQLSSELMDFWKNVIEKEVKIAQTMEIQTQIADHISQLYFSFNEIDQQSQQKDYKIYYVFAMIQKQLLNDRSSYDLYISKMKSILSMKKLLKNNYSIYKSDLDIGIVLVNAYDHDLGKIIYANEIVTKSLGYQQNELEAKEIGCLQPNIIKQWHQNMVKEYTKTGRPTFMHQQTNLFYKKKNGYIIPIQQIVRHYYSDEYEQTFICFASFLKEIDLLQQGSTHPTNQVMFMLCSSEDGKIHDVSENCHTQLRLDQKYLNSNELQTQNQHLSIVDICPEVESMFNKDYQESLQKEKIYKLKFNLDINILKQLKLGTSDHSTDLKQYTRASLIMFKEKYCKGKYGLNIVAITLENGYINLYQKERLTQQDQMFLELDEEINIEALQIGQDQYQESSQSCTGSQSSANNSKSSDFNEALKQSMIGMNRVTPYSLKIVNWLMIVVYFIMIAISSINLSLVLSRQSDLKIEIKTVQNSFERINLTSKTRNLLRQFINVANEYEPITTLYIRNRFSSNSRFLFNYAQQLIEIQSELDRGDFRQSEELDSFLHQSNVELSYLSPYSEIYLQNHTNSFTMNLYASRLQEISGYQMEDFQGNHRYLNLTGSYSYDDVSIVERTVFFAVDNSYLRIVDRNFQSKEYYSNETIQHSKDSIKQNEFTMIISIICICIVSIIVAPLLTRIIDRQFNAFKFFFDIPIQRVEEILKSVQECKEGIMKQNKILVKKKKKQKKLINQNNQENNSSIITDINVTQKQLINQTEIDFENDLNEQNITDNDIDNNRVTRRHQTNIANQNEENQQKNKNDYDIDQNLCQANKQANISIEKSDLTELNIDEQKLIQDDKQRQISKKQSSNKFILTLKIIFTAFVLSCYFFGAEQMGDRTFLSVESVIKNLNLIFFRDGCIESLLSFQRENIFRNTSIIIIRNGESAFEYYHQLCTNLEQDYIDMRKDFPDAFLEIQQFIEDIEEDKLCDMAFEEPSACKRSMNGLLNKGVGNFIQYLLKKLRMNQIAFNSSQRTVEDIERFLWDRESIYQLEIKQYVIEPLFQSFKQKAVVSTNNYFQRLSNQYMILFICFTIFLSILLIYFLTVFFKKIRDHLWKTNVSLKIIPIESLSKEGLHKFKDFLKF